MPAPKRRFSGFLSAWEERALGDIGSFKKGSTLGKSDLSDDGEPCILYGELYTKYSEIIMEVLSKAYREEGSIPKSKKGDVLIPSSGETAIDISTSSCLLQDNVLIGGDINIFRPIETDGRFISYVLNHKRKKEIARIAQGASIVHVYGEAIKRITIPIPSLPEQTKIADFLSLIDSKIGKQEQKVESLEEYKKGLMQKIFSQEIRFRDENGEEYPEWEEAKLEEMSSYQSSSLTAAYIREIQSGEYPVFDANSIIAYVGSYSSQKPYISIIKDGAGVGRIVICPGESSVIGTMGMIHNQLNTNLMYLYYTLLNRDLSIYISGSTIPHIYYKDYKNMKLACPSFPEQTKIADFLSGIDRKIEKEKQLLETLREGKKGFLQQMFV